MTEDEKEHVRNIAAELYEKPYGENGPLFIPLDAKVSKCCASEGYWVEAVVWVGENVVHGEQQTLPDA